MRRTDLTRPHLHSGAGTALPDLPETCFAGARDKLIRLSLDEDLPGPIRATLERLAALDYVESVLALPDVHWKERMEVPSSIAITTRGVIVPEFTSVAVNDGMGVVQTSLREEEMTPERIRTFFGRICSHAAKSFFDTNRYSIGTEELFRVVTEGAPALVGRYGLDPQVTAAMEDGGRMAIPGSGASLLGVVPLPLLMTRFSRSEMGLNFGGNHFLEIQVVDDLVDPALARQWGFSRGQIVVMYHLGPGPFGGTLLNHYALRDKVKDSRRTLFLASKLLFHYVQRMGRGRIGRKWDTYFRRHEWNALAAGSPEGLLLRQAFAMAINFGYGYRLATIAAIGDALRETVSEQVGCHVFCDISHNGVTEEAGPEGVRWVARHNACRLEAGAPTLVAGSYDVASYLGVGGEDFDQLHSYDHGAGNLIEHYREAGRLTPAEGEVTRMKRTRGRGGRVVRDEKVPIRTSEPIDRLMECFEKHAIMRRVVRLRPLGNLKN